MSKIAIANSVEKIDRRKKYILVLDVESAGNIGYPMVYDIGMAVCDKKGNIYEERSFVIEEIFDNKKLMEQAYYFNKVPKYIEGLENGTHTKVPFLKAREELLNLMRKYDINCISAYNLQFDMRALKSTTEKLHGKGKKFLPKEFATIELLCIWSFACEVIFTQPTFQRVAIKQGWLSPKENLLTNAEVCHRYITSQYHFEEEHTGLEDVRIEVGILAKCYAQRKKHESGIINNPWRIPNKLRKEREQQE